MDTFEKVIVTSFRVIGVICFLMAVISPIVALVMWRFDILIEGVLLLIIYALFVSSANEAERQFAEFDKEYEEE